MPLATNITRFITACQRVGMPHQDVFDLHDLHEASESSLRRVARTVLALAALAQKSAVTAERDPSSSSSFTVSSPRIQARRAVRDGTVSPPLVLPGSTGMYRQRSSDSAKDPGRKFPPTQSRRIVDIDATLAYYTPTSPQSGLPAQDPMSNESGGSRGQTMIRARSQPGASPGLRPRHDPTTASPVRSTTPVNRPSSLAVPHALRPRYTTGSKIQVSFADQDKLQSPPGKGMIDRSTLLGNAVTDTHWRERTPSLISSGSRIASRHTMSSAALSEAAFTVDHEATTGDTIESDIAHTPTKYLRERRMSEKTLQDARQKILGKLLSSEDPTRDLREALGETEDSSSNLDESRGLAHSQTLAALEGWRVSPRPGPFEVSPRHRPSVRRGQRLDVSHQGVDRLLEEDEQVSAASSTFSSVGARPSAIRRYSANGKVYVPKRSISPAPYGISPSTAGFPFHGSISAQGSSEHLLRPQSAGHAPNVSSDASYHMMNWKNRSIVNLSTPSAAPSLVRGHSANAVATPLPFQVLEFNEPGFPPVRYVRQL